MLTNRGKNGTEALINVNDPNYSGCFTIVVVGISTVFKGIFHPGGSKVEGRHEDKL